MMIFFEFNILFKFVYLFCLYEVVAATLNKYLKRQKIIIMALLGGMLLSLLALIDIVSSFEFFFNIVVIMLVCFVVFKPRTIPKAFLIFLTTFSYTLLKWGFSYLLQLLLFNFYNITIKTLIVYYILDVILVAVFSIIIYIAFRVSYQRRLIQGFVYDVEVSIGSKTMLFKMLLDSGNSLVDDRTGKPVIVISKYELESRIDKKLELNRFRPLAYQTLGGYCSNLFILEVDSIYIKKGKEWKQIDAVVGIVEKQFKLYDGLLHTQTI